MGVEQINAMAELTDQVGIVTGAGRGIGRAIAVALAEEGVHLVLNDVADGEDLSTTQALCEQHGVQTSLFPCDAGDDGQVAELVNVAVAQFGGVNLAVSNAAYSKRELFVEADMDEFARTIQVTMWGPLFLTQHVSRAMIRDGRRGAIVVIGSPHSHRAIPGSMAYNMSKAAVDQMARTAAVELAQHRIRVNIIHPGWVNTPGERKFFSEEKIDQLGSKLPWGRLAKPEEIARGVVFLCDPASEYITGTTLCIDGGILLPFAEMHRVNDNP